MQNCISSCGSHKRGWLAVAGGFLLHLSLGTIYTIGNMVPYVTSYIRTFSHPKELRYTTASWLFAGALMGMGTSMFVGGIIHRKLGSRLTSLLGGWIMSGGVLLTAVAVKVSFFLTLLTYGLMVGIGVGLAYTPPMACAMQWLPGHKGLVNGIVVAGFGGGAFIFNQVQTVFINPHNLLPDQEVASEKFFSKQEAGELLERVPRCFLLLGGCYAAIQLLGALLLADPPEQYIQQYILHQVDENTSLQEREDMLNTNSLSSVADVHPLDVMKTRAFYTLWAILLFNGQTVFFIGVLYKAYGQTFINDDHFLSIVGAFASMCNAAGRIVWGYLADRTSFKFSMMLLCPLMMILTLTLSATEWGGKPMFFIWICLIFFMFSGTFVLLPTATAKAFGESYVGANYGLVFTAQVVTPVLGAVLTTSLTHIIGWFGMFCLISTFGGISWLLAFSFNRTFHGEEL